VSKKYQSIVIMPSTFAHEFKTPTFQTKVAFSTGLFINGQFVDGSDNTTIEYDLPLSLINHFWLTPTILVSSTRVRSVEAVIQNLTSTLCVANGKVITSVSEGTSKDVDLAVEAAHKAFDTTWGLHAPGAQRSILMAKLAALMEKNADELAALEALDNGQYPD
jgi:aldehyde dehydrogenase (NAD+)